MTSKVSVPPAAESPTEDQSQPQVVAVEVVTSQAESKPSTSATTTVTVTSASTNGRVLYQVCKASNAIHTAQNIANILRMMKGHFHSF